MNVGQPANVLPDVLVEAFPGPEAFPCTGRWVTGVVLVGGQDVAGFALIPGPASVGVSIGTASGGAGDSRTIQIE